MTGEGEMTTSTTDVQLVGPGAAEVHAFMMAWQDCINDEFPSDPGAGLAYFNDPPDVQYFDLMTTRIEGEAFVKHFWEVAPNFANAHIDFVDLKIHAGEEYAFASMLQHYKGKDAAGNAFEFRFRVSDGLQKIDGRWKIVHEHISFPVDLETQTADMTSTR
jgi:ketosteroid isomerase-like protein